MFFSSSTFYLQKQQLICIKSYSSKF